jgi:hypothetical protein
VRPMHVVSPIVPTPGLLGRPRAITSTLRERFMPAPAHAAR